MLLAGVEHESTVSLRAKNKSKGECNVQRRRSCEMIMMKIESQGRRSCGVWGSERPARVCAGEGDPGESVCDDCEVGCRTSAGAESSVVRGCSKNNQHCGNVRGAGRRAGRGGRARRARAVRRVVHLSTE